MIRNGLPTMLVGTVVAFAPLAAVAQDNGAPVVASMSLEARQAAETVDAFHAALAKGDGAAAAALLAEDALIYEGGHAEYSRAEYASQHAGADAAYAAGAPSKLLRRGGVAEGVVAWITSESRATGTYKDKPVDRVTTETMILHRTPEGWRIVHIHWSGRPAT